MIFLIKLKLSEAFGEKIIFWTEVLCENQYESLAKKPNFTLVSYKETIREIVYFPFDTPVHWFLSNIPFL